jgi:hypothetical protein
VDCGRHKPCVASVIFLKFKSRPPAWVRLCLLLDNSLWTGTYFVLDLDNWVIDELDNGIDDEDDLMEPAPQPASESASEPASEAVITELKQLCINTMND